MVNSEELIGTINMGIVFESRRCVIPVVCELA